MSRAILSLITDGKEAHKIIRDLPGRLAARLRRAFLQHFYKIWSVAR